MEPLNLIDQLLKEQQSLTSVERYSVYFDKKAEINAKPLYKDLIPITKPSEGEQYAFEVNLDQCSGCKACVTACHSLNGLDESETWRATGVLVGTKDDQPYQQIITGACHHCVDPACQNGCPVLAYEKDETTGIVRHLDDQCIGCQYCVLKCPYDVPKYNEARGIVRKCDMCHSRLAVGEAPACVQACPHEAIVIRKVKKMEVLATKHDRILFPGTITSHYTTPTTSYVSERGMPATVLFGDDSKIIVEDGHTPLVMMLVFTQMAAGCFIGNEIQGFINTPNPFVDVMGWVALMVGLTASIFHLGRPQIGWKAFLGWRKSWLSREVIAFGIFAFFSSATTFLSVARWMTFFLPHFLLQTPLRESAVIFGLASIWCSIMVYVDTQRPSWRLPYTGFKFFGTTLVLGITTQACFSPEWRIIGAECFLTKIGVETALYLLGVLQFSSHLERSAKVILKKMSRIGVARITLGVAAATTIFINPFIALLLGLAGELLERRLFFQTVIRYRMPGHIGS